MDDIVLKWDPHPSIFLIAIPEYKPCGNWEGKILKSKSFKFENVILSSAYLNLFLLTVWSLKLKWSFQSNMFDLAAGVLSILACPDV